MIKLIRNVTLWIKKYFKRNIQYFFPSISKTNLFINDLTDEQIHHIRDWIKALCSGKYQQNQKSLRQKESFCCLGVACEISGLGTWEINSFGETEKGYYYIQDGYDKTWFSLHESLLLNPKVQRYFGLKTSDGRFLDIPNYLFSDISLVAMNDSDYSFNEIADVIETELKLVITGRME